MDERDFWSHLEWRVCREMYGFEECRQLRLWCDGFAPEAYVLDSIPAYIEGITWIVGFRDSEWRFKFVLNVLPKIREDITWSDLLPADDVTEWLLVDVKQKHVLMDLRKAIPLDDAESESPSS